MPQDRCTIKAMNTPLSTWLDTYTKALTAAGAVSEHSQCLAFLTACQKHALTLVQLVEARQKTNVAAIEVFTPQVLSCVSDWDSSLDKLKELAALAPNEMERLVTQHCRQHTPLPDDVFYAFEKSVTSWKYKSHRTTWYQSLTPEQSEYTVRAAAEKNPNASTLTALQKDAITEALHNVKTAQPSFWREAIAIVREYFPPREHTSDAAIRHVVTHAPTELQSTFIKEIAEKWVRFGGRLQEGEEDTNRFGQFVADVINAQPRHMEHLVAVCIRKSSALLQSPALKNNALVINYLLNDGLDRSIGSQSTRQLLNSWIHGSAHTSLREKAWTRKLGLIGAKISDVKQMDTWTPTMHKAFNYWMASSFEKHHTKGGGEVYTHINREVAFELKNRFGIDLRNPAGFDVWRKQQEATPHNPFAAYALNAMLHDSWEEGCLLYLSNTQSVSLPNLDPTLFLSNIDCAPLESPYGMGLEN